MSKAKIFLSVFCSAGCMAYASGVDEIINRNAKIYGVDEKLIRAVIKVESSGNPRAHSDKDARGLMQVIPSTAARMRVDPANLYHPEHNITAGTRYLAYLSRLFNGRTDYILAAYHAGEGTVQRYGGLPPYEKYPKTNNYVAKVKKHLAVLQGADRLPKAYSWQYAFSENKEKDTYRNWVFSLPPKKTADPKPDQVQAVKVVVSKPKAAVESEATKPSGKPEHQEQIATYVQKKPKSGSFVQTLDGNGNFVDL